MVLDKKKSIHIQSLYNWVKNKIPNFRRAGRRVGLKCSKYLPAIDSSVATPANFSSFESFDMESLSFKFVS